MRNAKMLGLLVMATSLLAFAATATAATPLTSPAGTGFEGSIHAEAEGAIGLHSDAFSFTCKKSTFSAEFEAPGSATTAKAQINSLAFVECGFPVTVKALGSLEVHSVGGGNGTVTWSGGEFTVDGPFGINCLYKTSNTHIGTLTGSKTTGATATLDLGSALIPRTGHSAFCGTTGEWTGSYKVTSPDYLAVDDEAPLSTPLTSPAGTGFKGALHAESEGTVEMHGEAFSFNCKSTLSAEMEASGSATTAAGEITSLALSECSFPVTVLKTGSLEIHSKGSGNGTATWTGGEFTVHGPFGINCIYKTSSTHIGNLTGSKTTGATATLDIGTALIPRTGHNAFCGGWGEWTGSYRVTTPDYLAVD